MFKIDGKYGNLHIDGMSKDIDKININELDEYLIKLEKKRIELIKQQNEYLSKIIN